MEKKTFADGPKTSKVFSLESFPLYGTYFISNSSAFPQLCAPPPSRFSVALTELEREREREREREKRERREREKERQRGSGKEGERYYSLYYSSIHTHCWSQALLASRGTGFQPPPLPHYFWTALLLLHKTPVIIPFLSVSVCKVPHTCT